MGKVKIVGVSACPAGLAHTPMAAAALIKAGDQLGYDVKIEQQGVMGQVDVLSKEDINDAEFVLIASDQKIEDMDRFDGKKIIRVNINACINAPKKVIEKCMEAVKGDNLWKKH